MTEQEAIQQFKIQKQFNLHPDRSELLDMAIKALEKQVPKKPLNIESCYDGDYGYCPCCNSILNDFQEYRVCSICGQKLDWSV